VRISREDVAPRGRTVDALVTTVLLVIGACTPSNDGIATPTRDAAAAPLEASGAPKARPAASSIRIDDAGEPTDDAFAAAYPVRWVPEMKLHSLADVDEALRAETPDTFGELALDEKTVTPRTCREWASLVATGWGRADDNAYPDVYCGTLLFLERSKASTSSFVHDLRFDRSALAVLPADLATALSAEEEARVAKATREGRSLKAFDRKARVEAPLGPSELRIREGSGESLIVVQPEAWGDVDGDGVEDMLVYVVNGMLHGTYSGTRLVVLSRSRPGAVLREVGEAK
jgi:hypothetical protein